MFPPGAWRTRWLVAAGIVSTAYQAVARQLSGDADPAAYDPTGATWRPLPQVPGQTVGFAGKVAIRTGAGAEVERLATQIVHIPQSNARAGFGFLPTAS